ncbi:MULTISPECIES: uroporphyrinogen-III synthase [unclassified Nocardioides]|jgi:uroporphyrinogen III methyltransferase/synthase|uniref:uroporphyrinogen-III synthase n=1 Tax=unclassified Nocardioides TaxID=2615069 RepID=UPI000702D14E|nr:MULTISPECIES: uroporphyrinogen-III synthase [unclassified Nocardioides]KRC52780.1 bifunctional uroporphyrinogen-III C-methyltransferase/uroporphyrinogen-III synthase [Nocardioides sp. Root79]KRC72311.1 bifunctional uroporphyrinogen-III C-methyltransferase/uroporphyrinogen-III synthase [Nocardioides sp. Root240]
MTRATTAQAAPTPAPQAKPGGVAFVGTGPGDPDLLTVRAVRLIEDADVVITEEPGHADMVQVVRARAAATGEETSDEVEFIDGGFGEDGQPLTHAARAKVVVKQAKRGVRVVRLLGGDPFLYASGPEEAQAVAKAGLGFEVVPGVSSVGAVPAYAGIPLTTKDHREVAVVTCGDKVDWTRYADTPTLVLLSAVGQIGDIAKQLIATGRSPQTPVAMTRVGTTTEQQTITSTLERIAADVRAARITPPAITVIGSVVDLREKLSWFETKPLFGWRVLVPRTKEQSASLSNRLREFGGVPEEVPTISVEPPRNPQQMDKAVRGLVEGRYEWIAFTSVNAVKAVREKFEEYGLDARAFSGLKIAAVGDKTAAAIAAWGLRADLVPSGEQSAAGLLEDWPEYDEQLDPINRVFLPRADIATENLVAGLIDLGWECDDVTAYRTVRAAPPPAPTRDAIKTGKFDAVVFTSSSTVRNLVGIAGKPHPSTVIAVIGPATAKTAQEHGLRVDVIAPQPDVDLLVEALAGFGSERRAAMVENGEPVTKPSDRKPSARRRKA